MSPKKAKRAEKRPKDRLAVGDEWVSQEMEFRICEIVPTYFDPFPDPDWVKTTVLVRVKHPVTLNGATLHSNLYLQRDILSAGSAKAVRRLVEDNALDQERAMREGEPQAECHRQEPVGLGGWARIPRIAPKPATP